ncbi:cotranscriptional regulator FAM172A homolog isoform X3 [Xiphias gladius]|uniref:cotranscriptional regulator FAM172A homolog isoform X3 n=1 Tax=Xiphias gladius TaxID=8245 RepID=UPI001A986839|nr:cotranscriptional regulator FAM172A homolog isoform X3 [Xiphias gladius]
MQFTSSPLCFIRTSYTLVVCAAYESSTVGSNVLAHCHLTGAASFYTITVMVLRRDSVSDRIRMHLSDLQEQKGLMLSHLCSHLTTALYILWITMAQVAGQEDREKTTALKDLLSRIDLDELMKKDEPPFTFPKTLEEFEYVFNEHGQLRHIKTGEPFVFNAREDLHRWNQKRYEALGEEGYGVMVLNPNENYLEMEKPVKSSPLPSPTEPSDEPAEKRERKDDKEGKKKREFYEKYRNPQKETETERIPIRENGSSEEHVLYVWDHFVSKAAAKNVFIMAHSYGGLSFVELMNQREMQVKNRVCAVALTDSAHNIWLQETSKGTQDWMQQHCCNWVSSSEPLDTPLDPMLPDCPRVSAGTERHELTSWMSFISIFRFFSEVLEAKEGEEAEETSNTVTTRSSSLKNKHQDL